MRWTKTVESELNKKKKNKIHNIQRKFILLVTYLILKNALYYSHTIIHVFEWNPTTRKHEKHSEIEREAAVILSSWRNAWMDHKMFRTLRVNNQAERNCRIRETAQLRHVLVGVYCIQWVCVCVCSPWRHRQCGAVYRLRCLPNHSYVRTTHNHEWICSLYLSVPSFSHLCTLHTCSDHSMPSALKSASYAHRIPTTYVCNQQKFFFFSLFFFFRASFTKSICYAGTDTYTHEQLYTLE